mmetsp:Transcript_1457/g.4368  ORF Transcript_1457/g.4368 Transcript_1457/m.4368 type:complete len:153 (+) Transcript_1457:829-1287(+)
MATLHADSSVLLMDIPTREIKKCRGDNEQPYFPFADGIFKGSLRNSFSYSTSEPRTVIKNASWSREEQAVTNGCHPLRVSHSSRVTSEQDIMTCLHQTGPQKCGIAISRGGRVATFVEGEGYVPSTPSQLSPIATPLSQSPSQLSENCPCLR